MKLSLISFTETGIELSKKIREILMNSGTVIYTKCSAVREKIDRENILYENRQITDWAKAEMESGNALIFIGACGIAVRAIAPNITDKLHDVPVLVIDEKGRYVIPILSGHMGGANELALAIAAKIGAEPVITTATDINEKFAVDIFAKKNNLFIVNKEGIVKVSSKILAGKKVNMSVESGHIADFMNLPEEIQLIPYPPDQPVDILITSENKKFDSAIMLKPKEFIIGFGCKKGKESEKIEEFIQKTLEDAGISLEQAAMISSIEQKKNETGILAWSRKKRIPFVTYTAQDLEKVEGKFHTSDFVKKNVGVDNVCERAALKACGTGGRLIYEKHVKDGMTIAIARRNWRIDFYEK